MENAALDRNTRAIFVGSLGGDLAATTAIGMISSLVTLYIIATTDAPQLALSAVIITTFLYVFLSAINTMDQFKASIADMDDQDSASHSGQHGKKHPSLCGRVFIAYVF